MQKTITINASIESGRFVYEGTEQVKVFDLLKLTEGHAIEIVAKGEGIKITIILLPTKSDYEMKGHCSIEIKEHVE